MYSYDFRFWVCHCFFKPPCRFFVLWFDLASAVAVQKLLMRKASHIFHSKDFQKFTPQILQVYVEQNSILLFQLFHILSIYVKIQWDAVGNMVSTHLASVASAARGELEAAAHLLRLTTISGWHLCQHQASWLWVKNTGTQKKPLVKGKINQNLWSPSVFFFDP